MKRGGPFGQLDLIEQLVVKALLDALPKTRVPRVWPDVREALRRGIQPRAAVVWDEGASPDEALTITATDEELSSVVRTGRPVRVLPLGELVARARELWTAEENAQERASERADREHSERNQPTRIGGLETA